MPLFTAHKNEALKRGKNKRFLSVFFPQETPCKEIKTKRKGQTEKCFSGLPLCNMGL